MEKKTLTFTFENPNRNGAFEQMLQMILIEKLAQQRTGK